MKLGKIAQEVVRRNSSKLFLTSSYNETVGSYIGIFLFYTFQATSVIKPLSMKMSSFMHFNNMDPV